MRRTFFHLAALSVLATVSGCSTIKSWVVGDPLDCSKVYIAPGLDTSSQYRPFGGLTQQDIQATIKLDATHVVCRTTKTGVDVDTQLNFTVTRFDPQLTQTDLSYFVALTTGQNILAKQPFSLRVEFAPNQGQIQIADTVTEHLPLKDPKSVKDYAVVVGLQVSQQQLDINRGGQAR